LEVVFEGIGTPKAKVTPRLSALATVLISVPDANDAAILDVWEHQRGSSPRGKVSWEIAYACSCQSAWADPPRRAVVLDNGQSLHFFSGFAGFARQLIPFRICSEGGGEGSRIFDDDPKVSEVLFYYPSCFSNIDVSKFG
jgi:hypothetical protein